MRVLGVFAGFFCAIAPASADVSDDALTRLVYLAEVTSYCSLADERVVRGFRRERDRIVAEQGMDEKSIEQARMTGWKLAHAEWQNRGLGGFRNWCRTEGADAAEHFRSLAGG